jgi:hypothetical protein
MLKRVDHSAAQRQRNYRQRKRCGGGVFEIKIEDKAHLVRVLRLCEALPEEIEPDHRAIEEALTKHLVDWLDA